MGGCMWVETSEVDVEPASDCLVLSVPPGTEEATRGGCVNPEIQGRNECNVPLVIPASPEGHWDALTVQPGDDISLLVDYSGNIGQHGSRIDFEVPAMLDAVPITLRFSTFESD